MAVLESKKPVHGLNGRVLHPRVVVALGYLGRHLVDRYHEFANRNLQRVLKRINPDVQVEVIDAAHGDDVVNALADPNTVGLIFISHSYETQATKSALVITSQGLAYPLPHHILSAATPSLRFASFLGCFGPEMVKEYEVSYQFDHLPGKRVFYYSTDHKLGAEIIDNVRVVLKKIERDLVKTLDPVSLIQGFDYSTQEGATLTVNVKDVRPWIEPRFVSVNDRIVGVLGSEPSFSNHDLGYREITFKVPALALETTEQCHTIKIESAELSPGAPTDDYLIQSISLEGPLFDRRERVYAPAWHIGEFEGPRILKAPYGLKFEGTVKERQEQYLEFIQSSYKEALWMDHDPSSWVASPLQGREYIDCI